MIQVINRAMDIIEYLAKDPQSVKSLSNIAATLNLNAGTCANIIKTLVDRGYIEKLEDKKGYLLGKKIQQLSSSYGYKKHLIEVSRPVMQQVTDKLEENTLLGILSGDLRIAIVQIQSNQDVQAIAANEKRAYSAASGRLLVGMLPDNELIEFITMYGLPKPEEWGGCSTKKSFLQQVEKIRKDGYATQQSVRKIVGVAVPVKQGELVIASLSIYMPAYRFEKAQKESIIRYLNKSAATISARLNA